MTSRLLTRAAFVSAVLGVSALAVTPAFAARNADAEQYVQANATSALRTLADRTTSGEQRRQTFARLMTQFADVPRISAFVLGRYGAQLRADEALRSDWTSTFQDYAIAVYENQLTRYSGGSLRVTNSIERVAGRDVIVQSEMTPGGGGRALPVQWRLLHSGTQWKVVDVSLVLDGREVWLAAQQQRDFLAALDSNRGDIRALIALVRRQTADMRSSTARG